MAAVVVVARAAPGGEVTKEDRLERLALASGEGWALEAASSLRGEGRTVSGGWPGTMSEARTRVSVLAVGGPAPSLEAHEKLARLLYASARRAWAALAVAETDD
ncbi:MAG: hypothetical protein K1X94_05050 [Sandaracinaceae bacterium]|nr:hypothetical protein [Sandaracinaceae bacterium]